LILPESNGQYEPSTEDWTAEQIETITQQARSGLDWWEEHLPLAQLRFHLEVHVVQTGYEPINHQLVEEELWIKDVLGQLGYTDRSYFNRAYSAAYDLRRQRGSDWATTIFVVNSDNDQDGRFVDGYFAYAYIGGPFLVLTSDNSSYGINRLNLVLAHELGHTFGALDQYRSAGTPCDRRSGYLNAPTSNSQVGGCPTNLPSIMLDPTKAFPIGAIDPSAQAQVGYRDSDADGIIDPLDTTPTLVIESVSTAQAGQRPVIIGHSADNAYSSPTHNDVSLNTIARVEYRIDDGPWQLAVPNDGAFDTTNEQFWFEPPVYDGIYQLEIRAVNSVGNSSSSSSLMVHTSAIGPQPEYRINAPAVSNSQIITLSLDGSPQIQAVQIHTEARCSDAGWQSYSNTLTYNLEADEDGMKTFYVCFRDEQGRLSLAYPQHVLLDTQPPTGEIHLQSGAMPRALLSAVDEGSGVSEVELQVNQGETSWQTYQSEIMLPTEAHAVRVRFRDVAGNVSPVIEASSIRTFFVPIVTS
ncbi:MAG: hypothetical protein MI924_23095, partial [Chloroflexales bacterium]|nr:hypothetical protein [Chloroflexales bacterium]